MKKIKLLLSIALALVFSILALYIGVFAYVFHDFSLFSCENDVYEELPSPSQSRKAVVFERSCGATTDFSTQVSIIGYGSSLSNDDIGNVYVAMGRPKDVVLALKWSGENELTIEGPEPRNFATSYDNVSILISSIVTDNKSSHSQP